MHGGLNVYTTNTYLAKHGGTCRYLQYGIFSFATTCVAHRGTHGSDECTYVWLSLVDAVPTTERKVTCLDMLLLYVKMPKEQNTSYCIVLEPDINSTHDHTNFKF